MASAAKSGQGSLLKIGDGGATEVFATIGEVLDIKAVSYTHIAHLC